MWKRWLAELIGTSWLVLGGCGSAVLALGFADVGIGLLGVSIAFGLALAIGLWMLGPVSGGHFNPAVTVGLALAGRFEYRHVPGYVAAQVLGALLGAGLLFLIASGKVGFDLAAGLDANGYAEHSPGGYGVRAAFLAEVLFTCGLVGAYLATLRPSLSSWAGPLVVGAACTMVHLVVIPVTNGGFNPARSTAPAVLVGGWALRQLWLFWAAPLLGAGLAAALSRFLLPGMVGVEEVQGAATR